MKVPAAWFFRTTNGFSWFNSRPYATNCFNQWNYTERYDHNWCQNSYEDFKIPPSHFYFGVLFWYYEKIGIFLINFSNQATKWYKQRHIMYILAFIPWGLNPRIRDVCSPNMRIWSILDEKKFFAERHSDGRTDGNTHRHRSSNKLK